MKTAGLSFEEDKMGLEKPDGKKKPAPKEGRKKPPAVPHFDNAKCDTNAPYAHDCGAYQVCGPRVLMECVLHALALLCRWMFFNRMSKWIVFLRILFAHVELGCGV